MNRQAAIYNEQGMKCDNQGGDKRRAEAAYKKAIQAAPFWSVPWYNLGLLYKHEHNWPESLRCNQKAAKLDPHDQPTWWNLGIAATALGDWAEARRAWRAYGIEVPDGEGEIRMQIGLTPMRINPKGTPEVVWCERIDPARALIRSVPLPQSDHRYGDILLNDGEPKGTREVHGKRIPVFEELQLLVPSDYSTFEVAVESETEETLKALFDLAEAQSLGIEDWGNIRHVCQACSEGAPPEAHEHPFISDEATTLGVAAETERQLQELLAAWTTAHPTCRVVEVNCALPVHQYVN